MCVKNHGFVAARDWPSCKRPGIAPEAAACQRPSHISLYCASSASSTVPPLKPTCRLPLRPSCSNTRRVHGAGAAYDAVFYFERFVIALGDVQVFQLVGVNLHQLQPPGCLILDETFEGRLFGWALKTVVGLIHRIQIRQPLDVLIVERPIAPDLLSEQPAAMRDDRIASQTKRAMMCCWGGGAAQS